MMSDITAFVLSLSAINTSALTADSSWGEVLSFLGLGLIIVLSTLIGLSVLCSVAGLFFKRYGSAKHVSERIAQESTAELQPGTDILSEDPAASSEEAMLMAVIAATAAVVLGDQPFRIARVTPAPGLGNQNSWSEEGRRQIFASHVFSRH